MERGVQRKRRTSKTLSVAQRHADVHRVLANPRRLMILWALADNDLSVVEIARRIGASLQSTSQHLRLMREQAMVCSRREGQSIYYRVQLKQGSPECAALCQELPSIKETFDGW